MSSLSLSTRFLGKIFLLACLLQPAVNGLVFGEENNTVPQTASPSAPDASSAQQQKPSANLTILSVRVRGNQIINTTTILGKLKTQQGAILSQEVVNEDIKRLYATGFFKDIRFDVETEPSGVHVILVVDEKPVIREIKIEGTKAFTAQKLRKEIKVIEGQILDERLVVEGVGKIEKKYADKGFRFAKVNYRIELLEAANEASIIVTVDEGAQYRIKKIAVEGNKSYSDKKLLKVIKTKKRNLWLLRRGVFDEDKFKNDLERLVVFYQDEGYLDAKAVPEFQYDEKSQQITVQIQVEEGERYYAGEVQILGNKIFPENEIWQRINMLPTTPYSQRYLAQDMDAIRKFYFAKGYMDVRVIPNTEFDRETNHVDVSYTIVEGDLYFVDKVKIRGNTKTKDIVIRRELRINPGERFDGDQLEKSKKRLERLGFFEEITYDTEPSSSATNKKDIVFQVKEKQTGELSFGAGYSSVDQFIGFAEISQRNFDLFNWPRLTGGGQSVSLRGRLGSISRNVEFSFVEPYFLNKKVSFGLDAYLTRFENRNIDFRHDRKGVGITFARSMNDQIKIGTGYTIEDVEVFDIEDDAADIIRDVEGDNILSRLKIFASRDTLDNVFNPTKGSVLGASAELVGTFLGGDHDFYILQLSGTKYWTLWKKSVLEWRNRAAVSDALGSSDIVPIFDRFFAGGLGSVRGYNFRRISPKINDRSIGGQTLFLTSLEYTFGIPAVDVVKAAVFIDAGEVLEDSYEFFRGSEFAVAVGPGLKINTPLGPFAFYYGYPIYNKDTEDQNGRFEFSLSRSF